MKQTLTELMHSLGCERWPERWEAFYNETMEDFDKNGCAYADPATYDALQKKYGVFPKFLDTYKEAAAEVAKNEPLSRFLALLCRAMKDRELIVPDLKELSFPKGDGIGYAMIAGLANASGIEYCVSTLRSLGLPDELIFPTAALQENGLRESMRRHDGKILYMPKYLNWNQRTYDGRLYRLGRLEYELNYKFGARAIIFRNEKGDHIALAHDILLHRDGYALGSLNYTDEEGSYTANVEETEDEYIGQPYDEKGFVKSEKVTLKKSEWTPVIRKGDEVIGLHIPADGPLDEEAVTESLHMAKEFFAKYFPNHRRDVFTCHSWLLDPQLIDIQGKEKNMSKFCARFTHLGGKSACRDALYFAFLLPDVEGEIDYSTLPDHTSLLKKLKALYMNGGGIYETFGYFVY